MIKKTLLVLVGAFVVFCVLVVIGQPDHGTSDASSGLITETAVMGFDECRSIASSTAAGLGATLIGIVDSAEFYMARIPTSDGSVLVTCSAADGRMAITKSPH